MKDEEEVLCRVILDLLSAGQVHRDDAVLLAIKQELQPISICIFWIVNQMEGVLLQVDKALHRRGGLKVRHRVRLRQFQIMLFA